MRTHGAFSGEVLVQRYEVLVWGAQYRLGVFGFLALEELRAEAPTRDTGNYGLLDSRSLLQWSRDNAEAFGGDNHTLVLWGGWVDGSVSICYHLVSPLSRSLYTGAIMQGAGCAWNQEQAGVYKQQSTIDIGNDEAFRACVGPKDPFLGLITVSNDDKLQCLRSIDKAALARKGCDLDAYLLAFSALGSPVRLNVQWLASQLDGHSMGWPCFLGWPTVDGSVVGLTDEFPNLLHQQKIATVPIIVAASLAESSLFCDALQAATLLDDVGATVSHIVVERLGSVALSVGLDTCYAFNTIIGWLWIVLPGHLDWLRRKSSERGLRFTNPGSPDFQAAGAIGRLWTRLARGSQPSSLHPLAGGFRVGDQVVAHPQIIVHGCE